MLNRALKVIFGLLFLVFIFSACESGKCNCEYNDGTTDSGRMSEQDCEDLNSTAQSFGSGSCTYE